MESQELQSVLHEWGDGGATPEEAKVATDLLASALEKEKEAVGYLEEALRSLEQQ